MAARRATLEMIPAALAEALQRSAILTTHGNGQTIAQREIIVALQNALDARRQRILVSQSEVNWVKWMSLILQAICTLTAIAMVHIDNRLGARFAMGLFSTAVAVSILMIAAHDRPFTGGNALSAAPLVQVQP